MIFDKGGVGWLTQKSISWHLDAVTGGWWEIDNRAVITVGVEFGLRPRSRKNRQAPSISRPAPFKRAEDSSNSQRILYCVPDILCHCAPSRLICFTQSYWMNHILFRGLVSSREERQMVRWLQNPRGGGCKMACWDKWKWHLHQPFMSFKTMVP